jgi:hypothetical protein
MEGDFSIVFSGHAMKQIFERGISIEDVLTSI